MDQPAGKKELRNFGLLVGGVFSIMGLWPVFMHGEPMRFWAVGLGAVLVLLGGFVPSSLGLLHGSWMWIGHVLGWINTRILLGLVFYGLITPMGMLFRLLGKDAMRRTITQDSPTYRVNRSSRARGHMKYQF